MKIHWCVCVFACIYARVKTQNRWRRTPETKQSNADTHYTTPTHVFLEEALLWRAVGACVVKADENAGGPSRRGGHNGDAACRGDESGLLSIEGNALRKSVVRFRSVI